MDRKSKQIRSTSFCGHDILPEMKNGRFHTCFFPHSIWTAINFLASDYFIDFYNSLFSHLTSHLQSDSQLFVCHSYLNWEKLKWIGKSKGKKRWINTHMYRSRWVLKVVNYRNKPLYLLTKNDLRKENSTNLTLRWTSKSILHKRGNFLCNCVYKIE